MHHYRLVFTHNGRLYDIARFDIENDAVPTPFAFSGNICTVMRHRIANSYHIQFSGELLSAIFAWRMKNPCISNYVPADETVVMFNVGVTHVLSGKVEMIKVYEPLSKTSRMPFV